MEVKFYQINEITDVALRYAVIAAKYMGKWVWVKNKKRKTWEIPGGHRETNEDIHETAKRELYEETGAIDFNLSQICVYSVKKELENESFGMLFYAEVKKLDILPENEIERIALFDDVPEDLSFPEIQPKLFINVKKWINDR